MEMPNLLIREHYKDHMSIALVNATRNSRCIEKDLSHSTTFLSIPTTPFMVFSITYIVCQGPKVNA
jgi:hypothetical protein